MKKLKKSNNRVFCGVCGGLAEYIGLDVTVVRLIVCVLSLIWGFGVLAYIIAALVMPSAETPSGSNDDVDNLKSANVDSDSSEKKSSSGPKKEGHDVPHSDEEFDSYFKKDK